MFAKKTFITIFISSLIFTALLATPDTPSQPQTTTQTDPVVYQQTLNNMGYWIGTANGILGAQPYQQVIKFQIDAQLVADGLFGLKTRQVLGSGKNDSGVVQIAAASAPIPNQVNAIAPSDPKPTSKPATTTSPAVSRGASIETRSNRVITMVATGYDGCYECNKPYYGYPSYIGLPLARGIVAVDPKVIPMGTKLYVEGYGQAIAADQGNAIKGNRIDLFFDSHQEALRWGMKNVKVTILG